MSSLRAFRTLAAHVRLLVMLACAVACAGDPGELDDSLVRGDEIADAADCARASGPPCFARDRMGRYCIPRCDARCATTLYNWGFWVTQYEVSNTLGVGEHQGPAVIGYQYVYDTRFAAPSGRVFPQPWRLFNGALWRQGDLYPPSIQFIKRVSNPAGESTADVPVSNTPSFDGAALCSVTQERITRFNNHGRTLADTVPTDSFYRTRNLIPMRLMHSYSVLLPQGTTASTQLTDTRACLDVIRDGFCDSRCGNCSYILPTGIGTNYAAGQPGGQFPTQTTIPCRAPAGDPDGNACGGAALVPPARTPWAVLEGPPAARPAYTSRVWYVGGSNWQGFTSQATGAVADTFTHCVDPVANDQQYWARGAGTISGNYGHNSNADAEAEFRQFVLCGVNPGVMRTPAGYNAAVCTVCGTPHTTAAGAPTQWPCVDRTNTAATWWARTRNIHNISDWALGRTVAGVVGPAAWSRLPKPLCSLNGQPVYGM